MACFSDRYQGTGTALGRLNRTGNLHDIIPPVHRESCEDICIFGRFQSRGLTERILSWPRCYLGMQHLHMRSGTAIYVTGQGMSLRLIDPALFYVIGNVCFYSARNACVRARRARHLNLGGQRSLAPLARWLTNLGRYSLPHHPSANTVHDEAIYRSYFTLLPYFPALRFPLYIYRNNIDPQFNLL